MFQKLLYCLTCSGHLINFTYSEVLSTAYQIYNSFSSSFYFTMVSNIILLIVQVIAAFNLKKAMNFGRENYPLIL